MVLSEGVTDLKLADWLGVTATAIAIFGVVLAIVLYRRSQSPKTLDYEVINRLVLPNDSGDSFGFATRVAVTFKPSGMDEAVELPQGVIFTVRIQNTGKRAIVAEDFVQPIAVKVSGQSREGGRPAVLAARIKRASSDEVITKGPIDAEALQPRLMNPNEWFEIDFLAVNNPVELSLTSRIIDQSRPSRSTIRVSNRPSRGSVRIGLGVLSLIAIVLVFATIGQPDVPTSLTIPILGFASLTLVWCALGVELSVKI